MHKTRNSSVELLRILSMLTIVAIHYMGTNSLGELTKSFSLEAECFIILKTIINYGVNIFVIITGYYMSTKTEVSVRKIVKLLFDITFYGVIIYLSGVFFGELSFSLTDLIKSAVPIFAGHRWFVKAYIVLFLLSPFIGKLLNSMDKKSHLTLIIISMLFFSIWPAFLPFAPIEEMGFGFVNFILLFIISGYLRRYVKKIRTSICVLIFLCATFITVFAQNFGYLGVSLPVVNSFVGYSLAHNNPCNIIACCALFMLFVKNEFHSRIINMLAASAFAIYLIHGDPYMMKYFFNNVFHAMDFQNNYLWIPHMIATSIIIYIFCFIVDYIKIHSVDLIINKIFDRLRFINYKIKA